MKNYLVKATIKFNDTQEKNEYGGDVVRKIGDVFNCTKERYEYLKEHNAVVLVGIEKEDQTEETIEKPKKKKRK